jgi:hypothetical protein
VPAGKGGLILQHSHCGSMNPHAGIHCMRVFRLNAVSTKMGRRFDDVSAAAAEDVIDI